MKKLFFYSFIVMGFCSIINGASSDTPTIAAYFRTAESNHPARAQKPELTTSVIGFTTSITSPSCAQKISATPPTDVDRFFCRLPVSDTTTLERIILALVANTTSSINNPNALALAVFRRIVQQYEVNPETNEYLHRKISEIIGQYCNCTPPDLSTYVPQKQLVKKTTQTRDELQAFIDAQITLYVNVINNPQRLARTIETRVNQTFDVKRKNRAGMNNYIYQQILYCLLTKELPNVMHLLDLNVEQKRLALHSFAMTLDGINRITPQRLQSMIETLIPA